ncbi:MAG: DUF3880 domain-containing protein [Desulfovibrio sp.]|jgi:hypothetical protein|nr:DUF3880 domain-containing protein [Desulfovibrio sp.]
MKTPHRVLLPGTGGELLRRELRLAFARIGLPAEEVHPDRLHDAGSPESLETRLGEGPVLLFSVNFQGLGRLRRCLDLAARNGSIIAVWFADNPWNILAGVRDKAWKSLPLFVTDDSFIGPLTAAGAASVHHLPLAACPELFAPDAGRDRAFAPPADLAPFVFVGRSAFPGRDAFFAGLALPDDLEKEARALLRNAGTVRPDLLWWQNALGLSPASFWPGKKARLPALGAERANLFHRARCLAAAAELGSAFASAHQLAERSAPAEAPEHAASPSRSADGIGLDLFGDAGWRAILPPDARLRPPVDYYARLPGIYAAASFNLCLTGLQLPRGLNQRHFDVWTAGGLLLSDATPGLELFPDELARAVTFRTARDMATLAARLESGAARDMLIADWQGCILREHCYVHRAQTILEKLRLD